LLICATELHDTAAMDRLADALAVARGRAA
jgi:hypothetical protein